MKKAMVIIGLLLVCGIVFAAEQAKVVYSDGIKFSLTDEDAKSAIIWGQSNKPQDVEKAYSFGWKVDSKKYTLLQRKEIVAKVIIETPYYRVAKDASDKKVKYLDLDEKEMDIFKSTSHLMVAFIGTGPSVHFPKSVHCILKDGDTVIQPAKGVITGKESIPQYSNDGYWWTVFIASFEASKINPKREYTFIIIDTVSGDEQKVPIDFAKIK